MLGRLVHLINNLPLWFFVHRAKTILDVGCGINSPINYFVTSEQHLDGLDKSPIDLEQSDKRRYRKLICGDIQDFQATETYDVITALDFIEHVTKEDGVKILDKMELMGRRVILVTPNGFIPQVGTAQNPFQEHRSGWSADDLIKRGYRVYGMFGPKMLREGTAILRYRPKFLWGAIVWLLAPIFFWLPRYSFSLLAVYDTTREL